MLELLRSPGYATSFLPACADSKFQDLKKSASNRNSKANEDRKDPKTYRPISLERLIYARVKPLIDSLLPKEQAGFQRGKSTVDQVVPLTQKIGDSFEAKKNAGVIFVNLTAAYGTVWHGGLTCKLLWLLPDKHMVKMIMDCKNSVSDKLFF